jgi:hypothetical protein
MYSTRRAWSVIIKGVEFNWGSPENAKDKETPPLLLNSRSESPNLGESIPRSSLQESSRQGWKAGSGELEVALDSMQNISREPSKMEQEQMIEFEVNKRPIAENETPFLHQS